MTFIPRDYIVEIEVDSVVSVGNNDYSPQILEITTESNIIEIALGDLPVSPGLILLNNGAAVPTGTPVGTIVFQKL